MAPEQGKMEAIIALAKRRGFVYPGSEIYGGLARANFVYIMYER